MKKVFIFTLLIFFFQVTHAQIDKGNFLIGAGLGFGFSNTNTNVQQTGVDDQIGETTTVAIDFTPKIGYFFANKFAAGVQFEITNLIAKTENEKNTASKFLAGHFLRYYFPVSDDGDVAFLLETNFGFGRTGVSEGSFNVSTSLLGFGIGPGVTIFSNRLIGIEALAKYNWVRGITRVDDVKTTERVSELDLSLGIQIYFTRLVRAKS